MAPRQLQPKKAGGCVGRRGDFKEGTPADDAGGGLPDAGEAGGVGVVGGDDDKKGLPASSSSSSSSAAAPLRRGGSAGGAGLSPPCCQVERCTANLTEAKRYHRRHKVCEAHFKAAGVMVASVRQRFCQQCSRFHELSEFDEAKRSCRRRLVGHNKRRRKAPSDLQGGGANHCRQVDQSGRMQITVPASPTYKHFQIR